MKYLFATNCTWVKCVKNNEREKERNEWREDRPLLFFFSHFVFIPNICFSLKLRKVVNKTLKERFRIEMKSAKETSTSSLDVWRRHEKNEKKNHMLCIWACITFYSHTIKVVWCIFLLYFAFSGGMRVRFVAVKSFPFYLFAGLLLSLRWKMLIIDKLLVVSHKFPTYSFNQSLSLSLSRSLCYASFSALRSWFDFFW